MYLFVSDAFVCAIIMQVYVNMHLTSVSLSQIAAFMWTDLHYQDARSRLSGMTASSTHFLFYIVYLIAGFISGTTYDVIDITSSLTIA